MLLQPLIENSIKHGLEPRISGGTVTLRSRITEDGRLMIEVEDDGVGMAPDRDGVFRTSGLVRPGTGIGMRNVRERMQVLYGDLATVEINSRPGRGTKVTLIDAGTRSRRRGMGPDRRRGGHRPSVTCWRMQCAR